MKEIFIADKVKYLEENYPFSVKPEVADRKRCIHCNSSIVVGNYKVFKDEDGIEYICCPNAPACNGTVIDWVDL